MVESIPSKPIHLFDVPEVKSIEIGFQYNFFVADESFNESGNEAVNGVLSERFLRKGTADITNLNARIPRYVEFDIALNDSKTKISTLGKRDMTKLLSATSDEIREALITGKIITEDMMARGRFKPLRIANTSITSDLESFMSAELNKYIELGSSVQEAANEYSRTTNVNSTFISESLIPPNLNSKPDNKKFGNFLLEESKVKASAQLNAAYSPQAIRESIARGASLSNKNLINDFLLTLDNDIPRSEFEHSSSEYIFDIPAVEQQAINESVFEASARVVGTIIEKSKIIDGKRYPMQPIIVAGDNISKIYDSKIAYGGTYEYSARMIAKFRIPVTTEDGRLYVQTILVASNPSERIQKTLLENRQPEPPRDINYHFEYSDNSLYITWAPPVNPQRDVKYYQIFRRNSTAEPFELIAHLDFDDSYRRTQSPENIDPTLIRTYSSMPTFFKDVGFNKDSSYIYALIAIDARQISSGYSTQIKVSFDKDKNKIKKEFVCYSGAPKQYPNWTMKESFFVDAIKDSAHQGVDIYFDPETYYLKKRENKFPLFCPVSKDSSAKYIFQFINTDRLLEKKFEAIIDDSLFVASGLDSSLSLKNDNDE